MQTNKTFNSKILLFGEYCIIHDAMGLAVPYDLFQGRLIFRELSQVSPKVLHSNQEIAALAEHLKNIPDLGVDFDFTSMDFDIEQGLFFESSIPQGFGIGSSGALTASVYERYARNKILLNDNPSGAEILKLKKIFGAMEAHFHGSSSGFDPLICYLNKPLLIKSKNEIITTEIPQFEDTGGAIFLLNTTRPRRTEPLVNLFLEKCKNESFLNKCKTELYAYNNNSIADFLANQTANLHQNVAEISRFQAENLSNMIPTLYQKVWTEGLQTGDFTLKLCGAGGGGFILGFTKNFKKARKMLAKQQIRVVFAI
jgi:mevalonate kinase